MATLQHYAQLSNRAYTRSDLLPELMRGKLLIL
jgi:hypothetical protein